MSAPNHAVAGTVSRAPAGSDRWIALGLFVAAFAALALTESAVGFTRDESVYFASAESYAHWYQALFQNPGAALSDPGIVRFWDLNHEHPALMKTLFGWSFLLFHQGLGWLRPAAAFRVPAFAISALIPALVYLFGAAVYGRRAGLFAALSFFCVPRQFFHAHLACFDMPIAAMWLVTVYAFWRAQTDRGWWLWTGIAFGLSLATKHNAFFLPVLLVPFALARAWSASREDVAARALAWRLVAILCAAVVGFAVLVVALGEQRFQQTLAPLSPQTAVALAALGGCVWVLWLLRRLSPATFRPLATIAAMAAFGPLLFYGTWPYLWHHPVERTAWYLAFHAQHNNYTWFYLGKLLREPPFPLEYVLVVTALTVPVSILLPMTLGLLRNLARIGAWAIAPLRARVGSASWTEALIGANALASIAIISHPDVPHFGGVKHWFPSMPFLGLLAGACVSRALEVADGWLAGRKVPAWAPASALFALLLAPAVIATIRVHPYGTSAYAELAGGLPGAASLGMQRQYWSNNVTGVLPWLNAHAPRGARLWLHEVNGYSFRDYQRNGMLRPDLQPAGGPQDSDFAVYQYHQEFREQEMDIWGAYNTQTPVTGLYLDETPQIVVYRR